jgi:hypothetical protein
MTLNELHQLLPSARGEALASVMQVFAVNAIRDIVTHITLKVNFTFRLIITQHSGALQ